MTMRLRSSLCFLLMSATTFAAEVTYQRPSDVLAQFVEAKQNPWTLRGPDERTLLLGTPRAYPSVAELAAPELRLAGIRVNPRNHGLSRRGYTQNLELLDVRAETPVVRKITGLPSQPRMGDVSWSPDGKTVAFANTTDDAITEWSLDAASGAAKQLSVTALNGITGRACHWLPDSQHLVCLTVPTDLRAATASTTGPTGPIVQENEGAKRPARTNPNLLTKPSDELQFEYFASSQIVVLGLDGSSRPVGKPGLYLNVRPSPDGSLLLVEATHRPFSYQVDVSRFPLRSEVWSLDGKIVQTIANLPLAESVTVDFDSVRVGRRSIDWRSDVAATVCWVEAKDGGDAKAVAAIRDELACLPSPFTGKPAVLASMALRFSNVAWGSGSTALVTEAWFKDRTTKTWVVAPDRTGSKPKLLWDRSSEDRYSDPGQPVMRSTPMGTEVLRLTSKGRLLLIGDGASTEGDRPFFDRLDLTTGKSERLWRSEGEQLATVKDVLDDDGDQVLLTRESVTVPPQVFVHSFSTPGPEKQLTHFPLPVPELAHVTKRLIGWKRSDGQTLSGTLYLPGGFRPGVDKPLPVLVWVYPAEFKSAAAAAQVNGSPYEYAYPYWGGPLFALTQGYAVVDNPSFAIVGEGKIEPNDTYVEQLRDDASALIDEVVRLGVGDRSRFAVGGHSYGAFTTVNLLAHSDLFRTGIARSGAYNRTLTPFGFQSEERTFWEAPDTYMAMSPFRFADKIDEPLLLIHGADDDNPGTYTIQSDRLFAALQGLGGRVRYVSLPAEAHGYRARESLLHVLWEQTRWLDAKVKNAKPLAAPPAVKKP